MSRRIAVAAASALCLFALAGCGKREASVPSGDDGDRAVSALVRGDIEAPFFLALSKPIPADELDKNDSLEAVLATTTKETEPNGLCRAPKSSIALLPNAAWMAARLGHAVEDTALVRHGQEYQVSGAIRAAFQISAQSWMCAGWYYFDWGRFSMTGIERVNEFTAPDAQTMANVKVRSYRISAVFLPNTALAKAAPNAKYGRFTWIAAFEQDPVSLTWKLYRFDKDIHWDP